MQRNERRKLTKRICAAFLSFVMVLTLIPASTLSVLAATPEHENAITISVVDEDDKALSDATVRFYVDADANLKQSTETTDVYGTVVVMTADEFEQKVMQYNLSFERYSEISALTSSIRTLYT